MGFFPPAVLNFAASLWRRARKYLLWISIGLSLYTLVGFFLVPPILKWQLTKRLPDITKRQVMVGQVKVNPWTLSLAVRELELKEPDGRPFASWQEFYVNFQASSLFRWAWTFKEIRLVKPFGEIILLKDGRLNFANMLEQPPNPRAKPSAPASVPRINVFHLLVTNGFVALEDRTHPSVFRTEYRPINLEIHDFSTHPGSETPYSFRARSDAGRSIAWAGDFSVQPLQSSGHLEVTGVKLPRYQPYLEEFTRVVLTNGVADLQLDYRFAAETNGLSLGVRNGALRVNQVQALDPDTGEIVVDLHNLDVQKAGFNLRERAARIGAVKVSEASLLTRLKRDGHLNLLDLINLPATAANTLSNAAPGSGMPPLTVSVDDFAVERAAVTFEDLVRRTPFKTELKPIEVSVKGFSTRRDTNANYSFHVVTEAAETFEGAGSFSINPIRSSGEAKMSGLDVKKYLPYVEDFFRGKIVAGKVEGQAPYWFEQEANHLRAGVTNLAVKLTDLGILMPESNEEVTRVKEVGFEKVDASLEDRRGRVGLFKADGASVLVRRERDGAINLLGLLAVSKTNAAAPASSPVSDQASGTANRQDFALGGWTLNMDEIQLDNYTLKLEDLVPSKPVSFLLDQLSLQVKGLSTTPTAPITFNATSRFNATGAIAARGTAQLAPSSAEMEVAVSNIDLPVLQPYVEPFAALDIVSGALDTTGKLRFQTNDPTAALLTFDGSVRLAGFALADSVQLKEFLRWDDLAVTGIEAGLAPNRLKIEEIRLTRPKASLLIDTNRQMNLFSILRRAGTDTNATPVPSTTSFTATNSSLELFPIQLGTLTLDRASFDFADESVQPPVTLGIEELSGTVKGLSSVMNTPADLDLAGKVGEQSQFSVRGQLNPFPAARLVDLAITNANTRLTPLTGYMEKYGGYPLKAGLLSTSLRYHVSGTQLNAENKIQVDRLALGPHNNSPDATKLPLKLGIALLKDSDGRIELDVPVTGKIDDPEFSLGPIILKVLVNIIVKAAASPFKLLGALVGGGEELSYVDFTPGSTNLVQGELEKLGKLASALAKRPTLNLEIEGAIDVTLDRDALARQKLEQQLQAKWLEESAAKGRRSEPVTTSQLESGERERLLRGAFVEAFGTNIAEIIHTNAARLAATNQIAGAASKKPHQPPRNLWQRITGLFGGGSPKMSAAEKRLPKSHREALNLATPELMEELLAEKVQVTDEEFRQLMTVRAQWVQNWLVQNGGIAPDRVFLVAPKPIDANYQGESRATLSLE
jgi:hypothetical protein